MVAGLIQRNYNNEFINCGFVPDYMWAYVTAYDESNTVNGKPIGIFFGINNLNLTNASLYGQLIFGSCSNLTLSNVHINKPCSIGIQLFSSSFLNQTPKTWNVSFRRKYTRR